MARKTRPSEYGYNGGIKVNKSLLTVVLDQ
jgi:hypothetical protein